MNEKKKPTAHHENNRKAHPPTTETKSPALPPHTLDYVCIGRCYPNVDACVALF